VGGEGGGERVAVMKKKERCNKKRTSEVWLGGGDEGGWGGGGSVLTGHYGNTKNYTPTAQTPLVTSIVSRMRVECTVVKICCGEILCLCICGQSQSSQ